MYKNPNLAPEERAKDLLSKMTLDEKFAQLHIHLKLNDVYDEFCKTGKFEVRGGTFSTPKSQDTINKLQEYEPDYHQIHIEEILYRQKVKKK